MRAIEWEETQEEIRETLTRLEGYIDYIGATDEDRTAYDAAKRDLMFLYTTTENMTRHLKKYWMAEFEKLLDALKDDEDAEESKK